MATKKTTSPTKQTAKKVTKKTNPKKEVTSLAENKAPKKVKDKVQGITQEASEETPSSPEKTSKQVSVEIPPVKPTTKETSTQPAKEESEVKEISLDETTSDVTSDATSDATPDLVPKETPTLATPTDVVHIEREPEKSFNKKLLIPLIIVFIALIALVVYQFVIKKNDFLSPLSLGDGNEVVDNNGNSQSKEFENPINGMYFSSEEADAFKDNKPVAVMVNNYEVARPSSGLSKADIIYEVVAEGGITRLMPIFYSQHPEVVSSVRSARYYFVELASSYAAEYIHWGAAYVPPCQKAEKSSPDYCPPVNGKLETEPDVDAYDRIVELGLPNLDGGNYSCDGDGCAFGRDPSKVGKIPIEHTAFIRFEEMLELAKDVRPDPSWHKYIEVTKWLFKDDAPVEDRGDIGLTTPITYNYWDLPGFAVKWEYDKENNEYVRYQGGVKQVDGLDDSELRAKTIVIRYTKQTPVGDKKSHLYHDIVGTGDALVFQDGQVIEATWTRTTHDVRDIYTDANGDQIKFVRGQIWVQLVPIGNEISYQATTVVAEPAQE